MHPSKFFNEVNIRVGIDTVEVFDNEPKLYNAVNNIFKDSYEYTRMYHKFRQEKKGQ